MMGGRVEVRGEVEIETEIPHIIVIPSHNSYFGSVVHFFRGRKLFVFLD